MREQKQKIQKILTEFRQTMLMVCLNCTHSDYLTSATVRCRYHGLNVSENHYCADWSEYDDSAD
jgi:hypothetical protein